MRRSDATALLVTLGCAGLAAVLWFGGEPPRDGGSPRADDRGGPALPAPAAEASGPDALAPQGAPDHAASTVAPAPVPDLTTTAEPPRTGTTAWPFRRAARSADGNAKQAGAPAVAVELAFQALRYVGVDPAAEQTWQRAIDDPNTPAGARSDLIEDLNQEGYLDNRHPTADDLPLVRARLELIERLAPHAIDAVNAAAFEEAYKDLLAMYVRLGGQGSRRR
jgi:hypothetical protein